MRDDIDGLIVQVEEAVNAAPDGEQRPVPGEDVGVELQVSGHVLPVQQVRGLVLEWVGSPLGGSRDFLVSRDPAPHRGGGAVLRLSLHHVPSTGACHTGSPAAHLGHTAEYVQRRAADHYCRRRSEQPRRRPVRAEPRRRGGFDVRGAW